MKRFATIVLFLAGFVLSEAIPCLAQVRTRWRLDFEHSKPRLLAYRDPTGGHEHVWYVVYTIKNNTPDIVPIRVDLSLFADYGKDLQNDVRKVDVANLSRVLEDRANAEAALFGYFHPDVLAEDVENEIITAEEKMGNRSAGIILESIANLRGGSPADAKLFPRYLNRKQLRDKRILRPGETLGGLAVFRGVDPRSKRIELQVSGLEDFVKIEFRQEPGGKKTQFYSFENKVYCSRYRFPGDEFGREDDSLRFDSRGWRVKKVGPLASKETLQNIVDALVGELRRAKSPAAAAPAPGAAEPIAYTPADFGAMVMVFDFATGRTFRYDAAKTIAENETAVWDLHEWWIMNKGRLVFDPLKNRFVVSEEKLPGQSSP